jgi:Mn2+/Fe2+ NRAMP family transporter
VINGVVAVPLMAVVILMASSRRLMGPFVCGPILVGLGWTATAVMGLAAVLMLLPG